MKKELQDSLYAKYPNIFKQKDLGAQETLMCWGIEVGDGWYDIIDMLCSCIKNDVLYNQCPPVEAVQVKEKFGGLRFYVNGGNDRIDGMISLAESMSYRICETCGAPGRPNSSGWISTLCEPCRDKRNQK